MNEEIMNNVEAVVNEVEESPVKELVEINSADRAMAGVVLGFAGVGVASTLAGAGFGIYKLVKFLKGKSAAKKAAAEKDEFNDDFFEDDEPVTEIKAE